MVSPAEPVVASVGGQLVVLLEVAMKAQDMAFPAVAWTEWPLGSVVARLAVPELEPHLSR